MLLRTPSALASAAMPTTKVWMPALSASPTDCTAAASSGPPGMLDGQGMQAPRMQHWPFISMVGAGHMHIIGLPVPAEQLGSPSVASIRYLGLESVTDWR